MYRWTQKPRSQDLLEEKVQVNLSLVKERIFVVAGIQAKMWVGVHCRACPCLFAMRFRETAQIEAPSAWSPFPDCGCVTSLLQFTFLHLWAREAQEGLAVDKGSSHAKEVFIHSIISHSSQQWPLHNISMEKNCAKVVFKRSQMSYFESTFIVGSFCCLEHWFHSSSVFFFFLFLF